MHRGELKVWKEDWDGTPVIRAEGEIDLATVDEFRTVAAEVVRAAPESVVIDLRKVTYVDSSGLGVLVATRKALGNRTEAVTIVATHPAVVQALEITGLSRVFRVVSDADSIGEATAAAGKARGGKSSGRGGSSRG